MLLLQDIGNVRPEDEIHKAEQKSWIDGQLKLVFT